MENNTPLGWASTLARGLEWPAVVFGGFWLGRYTKGLEHRVDKAEKRLELLVERHLPAVHRALAEIRGLLLSRRG